MNARRLFRQYSYGLAGTALAGVIVAAMGFALESGVHHLLWMDAMKDHRPVPLWIEGGVLLLAAALLIGAVRIAAGVRQFRRRQESMAERLAPLLRPLPESLPDDLLRVADWHLVADSDAHYAFTWGTGRPQIAVSEALWNTLEPRARRAVLYHEAAHAYARDPLQQCLLQVLADAFPPVGFRQLYARYLTHREIVADAFAVQGCEGDEVPLLTALQVMLSGSVHPVTQVGLAGALDARLQVLDTHQWPAWGDVSLRYRLLSAAMGILLTVGEGVWVICR